MMRTAAALMLLALAACQKTEPATAPPPLAATSAAEAPAASPSLTKPTPVLGWTMDGGLLLLGRQAPAFTGKRINGEAINLDTLRGHWTIVGFRAAASTDKTEDTFISALNSAAGQDPDLDYLQILAPTPGAPPQPAKPADASVPTALDEDGKIAAAFGINDLPMYLLIGPDLTIEAARGPLSKTPDNGIKDVIKGVAEIRKQIADPT